jgi:amino acid adenylation domain-containing protein
VRDHEQTPLGHVVRWSEVPRGTPLFESIVVFDRARLNTRLHERGGAWLDREFEVIQDPAFALILQAYGETELPLKISYDRSRFDDASIGRMLGHLENLLESMGKGLDRSPADLPILTATERHQVLVEWNQTRAEYSQDECLHELFEAQVERTPQAVAVVFEGEQLTYEGLKRRANQLARHLQRLGVGPEVLVGVLMERSLELVVALYGILKAGGAYVPLDPEYPLDRVAFMLKDAQVPVVLAQQKLAASLSEHGTRVICLDVDWDTIAQESTESPMSGATGKNLAYVIYTSGSTGRPKGVLNTHRAICNQLLWLQDAHQLTGADSLLQQISVSFDPSVNELFWPLTTGARLVVTKPEEHKDGAYLTRMIVDQEITTLFLVPSMLQLLLEDENIRECRCLKRVFCGGEVLPYDLQKRFFERLDAELYNQYGPTEATVTVTQWKCQRNGSLRTVPIGRPVANTQLYIVDSSMQPVPIGVPGELHIGGVQVARGYLNRPELTDERFIPDLFGDDLQARLYKTGDLARYRPDGNIEFLGRVDTQVKIRGFRIELGEIENVLNQHPKVKEAVVVARGDTPGHQRLVAYVVPVTASGMQPRALRDFLQTKLPDYMVPPTFVQLEALPLMPNGKVDRRSLPAPAPRRPDLEPTFAAPRTPVEKTLSGIWAEILGIQSVGIHDDFFDLGGHSLLATQVMARVREALLVDVPLRTLFDTPTVAGLAESVETLRWLAEPPPTQSSRGGRMIEEREL